MGYAQSNDSTDNFTFDINGNMVVVYGKNYDIFSLHRSLRSILKKRQYQIEDLSEGDPEYYQYVVSGQEISDFLEETSQYLKMIRDLGPPIVKIDHSGTSSNCYGLTHSDYIRLEIITNYLSLAATYIDLSYFPDSRIKVQPYCVSCGGILSICGKVIEGGWICRCGYHIYHNQDRIENVKGESEYRPEVTFLKECMFFQGKENLPLPKNLFSDLDKFFNSYGLSRESVLHRPLDKYGKRHKTSLRLLNLALKECGYSHLYKRANTIGREYWGWKLWDLDPYMNKIMSIYRRSQKAYESIVRTRKSNISTQGTLLRILEIVSEEHDFEIDVRDEDFKLCTTRDSKEECEYLWKETCRLAGIPYKRHF